MSVITMSWGNTTLAFIQVHVFVIAGSIDPWHVLSILKNQTNGEVAVYMKGIAHCGNMNPSEPYDPLSLKNGRKVLSNLSLVAA